MSKEAKYNNINSQLDATITDFIDNISGDNFVHPQEH